MKLKLLISSVVFLGFAGPSQASSVNHYKVTCDAALAGDVSKGEAPVRTEIQMTFCGLEMSGMLPPAEGEDFGGFWSNEEFAVCADQKEAGVAYTAVRSNGSSYQGFIAAVEGNEPNLDEESRSYLIGSLDSEYFEYQSQEDAPSLVTLVRQGQSKMLSYNFELANCYHQYLDFAGNVIL